MTQESVDPHPSVVWLHGMYLDRSLWAPAEAALGDGVRSIRVDLLGHGANRGTAAPWRFDQWVDDLRATIDALELDRPVLVGHSLGGWVAAALAVSGTVPLGGVLVVNHTLHLAPALRPDFEALVPVFHAQGIPNEVATSFLGLWYPDAHRAAHPDHMAAEVDRLTREDGPTAARVCAAVLGGPDLRARLADAVCPIAFLLGERDGLAPSADLVGYTDPACVRLAPGQAHAPLDPELVAAGVRGLMA